MIHSLILACSFFTMAEPFANSRNTDYRETYRPQFHYSAPHGWLNDPNGLVYYNGTYHMFYQSNPKGIIWGPMHWGHATSPDLMHWRYQSEALKPYSKGMIFSGSAIVDFRNVTGLKKKGAQYDPLVALYTLASATQSQGMAFSLDSGRNWIQYPANPVLPNSKIPDFRDPNVIPYGNYYVMAVAAGDRINFYKSNNLSKWEFLSDFGANPPQGDHKSGVWECPSLFTLAASGNGFTYWILLVSANGGDPVRGSVTQYFIGNFNGTHFLNANFPEEVNWADYGPDNYAAIPYNNELHGRRIVIGWMSNWQYAAFTPTEVWRGQMTIPRELGLTSTSGQKIHLTQWPVKEFDVLRDVRHRSSLKAPVRLSGFNATLNFTKQMSFTSSLLDIDVSIDVENMSFSKSVVGVKLLNWAGEFVTFAYESKNKSIVFDRRYSGQVNFHPTFAREVRHRRISTFSKLQLRLLVDWCSIEMFADGGLNAMTGLVFPNKYYSQIEVYFLSSDETSSAKVESMNVYAVKRIWN